MKVFCDNYDCMFIDEDGFCDCDKLNIVGGVCVGSYHGGRNATENDADERLKAETKALRELVRDMWFWHYEGHIDNVHQEEQTEHIDGVMRRMRELGVKL